MADVIQQLKSIMPCLTTVYYRQDNAGCYHCGHVIISSSKLGQKEGIVLKRLDFLDPQGGKGACDRKAATIKSHMRVFLNSGNDIKTPEQMFKAMVSFGGVPSLNVTLCEPFTSVKTRAFKIDGVSLLSNIEYSAEGIRVWRAYGIGPGKIVYQQKSSGQGSGALPALVVAQVHRSNFSSIKGRTTASAKPSGDEIESTGSGGEDASTSLFACPEDGCIKRFIRHSSVLRHLDCGKHQYNLEHETLYDKAAVQYAEQLEGQGATMVPVISVPTKHASARNVDIRWALKVTGPRRTRFTVAQRSYLTKKFKLGEMTGQKADPASVARSMMHAKDINGTRIFHSDDFLTANQIGGFFSRLASKKTLRDEEAEIEVMEGARYEADIDTMISQVVDDLTPRHPIVFDSFNLCELCSKGKLNALSIPLLREMCCHFGIAVGDIKVRRRKPYIEKLKRLSDKCTCNQL